MKPETKAISRSYLQLANKNEKTLQYDVALCCQSLKHDTRVVDKFRRRDRDENDVDEDLSGERHKEAIPSRHPESLHRLETFGQRLYSDFWISPRRP